MRQKKRHIYLHIGLPKSGSTSIQSFLGLNRLNLNRLGYDVFPSKVLHDDICAWLISRKIARNKKKFEKSICRPVWDHFERSYGNQDRSIKLMQGDILRFIQDSEYDRIIFSCEHLSSFIDGPYFPVEETVANEIGSIFSPFNDVTVICVFRNQLDFLASLYKNWNSIGTPIVFEEFFNEMLIHCNWLNIYRNFKRILPNARFKGLLFENFYHGGLQRAVLKEMGIELPDNGWELTCTHRNIGVPIAFIHLIPILEDMFKPHKIQYLLGKVRRFSESFYKNRNKPTDADVLFSSSQKRKIKDTMHNSNRELLNLIEMKDSIPKWTERYFEDTGNENADQKNSDAIELLGTYFLEMCERRDIENQSFDVSTELKHLINIFLTKQYPYDSKVALYGGGYIGKVLIDALRKKPMSIQMPPVVIDDWPGVSYLHSTHISEVDNAKSFNYDSVDFVILSTLKNKDRMVEKLIRRGVDRKKIITLTDRDARRVNTPLAEETEETFLSEQLQNNSFEEVQAYIRRWYERKPAMRDGYSKLGNLFRRDKKYEVALALFEKDRLTNRMTPAYRQIMAYLLSKEKMIDEAIEEINHAYLADPTLSDGYKLVYPRSDRQSFCDSDINTVKHRGDDKRCEAEHLLQLSVLYAQNEDWEKAAAFVSTAYEKDTRTLDGYAQIGEILSAFAQFDKALICYEQDHQLGRLSPQKKISYAKLLTHFGMVSDAEKVVSCAYAEDKTIKDGFATVGTVFRMKGQFDTAFKYFDKDRKLDRISPKQRHILADQLARKGLLKKAIRQVEEGYRDAPSLMNGYARVGNILREKGKKTDALEFYRLDSKQNRLTLTHRCIYVEILMDNGKYGSAIEAIKSILEKDSHFEQSRLLPIWLNKTALNLAQNGHIESVFKIVEHLYGAYTEVKDSFSKIAINIKDISPIVAKTYFENDWKASRQTLQMTEKYLKFLFDNGFMDEAKYVWDKVKKKSTKNDYSEEELKIYCQMESHSRRILAHAHSFKCPALLVAFPRSGSNFLQNIVTASSGYAASSIYSETGRFNPSDNILLKSHAIDQGRLKYEMETTRISFPPEKMVILFRDPHDIMRSFLEYVNVQRNLNMTPEYFLSYCSFNYAAQLKDWAVGREENYITVSDAYKRFVECWSDNAKWPETDTLKVRYEDLCLNPYDTFSVIANFLELDCVLDENAVKEKVALYSEENNRLRATAYAWKNNDQNTHELYKVVDREFKEYITLLGYDTGSKAEL